MLRDEARPRFKKAGSRLSLVGATEEGGEDGDEGLLLVMPPYGESPVLKQVSV